jgi:hypothetical protein
MMVKSLLQRQNSRLKFREVHMEPNKPKPNQTPHLDSPRRQSSGRFDSLGSRGQGPYTPLTGTIKPKSKSKLLPILAVAAVLGAGGVGVHYYTIEHNNPAPVPTTAAQSQNVLTLTGADLDQATTTAAIAAIKSGQNDNPLIAKLTEQQRQEIVSGERKFYKLPIGHTHTSVPPAEQPQIRSEVPAPHEPVAPTKSAVQLPRHIVHNKQAGQLMPAPIAAQDSDSQGRIQLALNGFVYGIYNVTNAPLTLDAPLMMGDVWSVTCLEAASGKNSVTVGIANVLNPVQTTLSVGQTTTFTVKPTTTAPDYAWFHAQAENGNPVAEYGLGHMYEYGIGETKDIAQAIHWYQQAANQGYRDAKQRLAELGQ